MEELYRIIGEVNDIIFRNEENGYTVIEIGSDEEVVVCVGTMPDVNVGEELEITGYYKYHYSYGKQFVVQIYQRKLPSTENAIIKYLSSGVIKGIGKTTARCLVENFGLDTLEVLKDDPKRVSRIKGITLKKAESFSKALKEIIDIREIMNYLEAYGITTYDAIRIWKKLGHNTINMIEENPYIICSNGIDIPFVKAEQIAIQKSFELDNKFRLSAAVVYVLTHNKNNGHTCLPLEKLCETTANYLKVEYEKVYSTVGLMIEDRTIIGYNDGERVFVFLPDLYESEEYSAKRIKLFSQFPSPKISNIDDNISEIEKNSNIKYAELQKEAIKKALTKGLLVLTGGPGTGKTTTLNAIIQILKKNGEKVLLAAPTGRAAQRMTELTGREAKTIHRLLEVAWHDDDTSFFKRNEKNMLECDALVIDELSMIDVYLFESVLRALPMGCRLILVGDTDQLPSVGPGNVLGDLIESGLIPVVQLKEIFRQSMQSLIITNAHRIVKGVYPIIDQKDNDFFFLYQPVKQKILETITELCTTRLPKAYGYSNLNDIQVLCPGRKGELGTENLNRALQAVLNPQNPDKKEIVINSLIFREGDKVMQTKNNYNILWKRADGVEGEGIFNGDVGLLLSIASGKLIIQFDDKIAKYTVEEALNLELAYAATVHKSQGSEFEAVVMPVYGDNKKLLYRNLLYTGVTRAKKIIIMVGLPNVLNEMVDNNKKTKRYSALKKFLCGENNAFI